MTRSPYEILGVPPDATSEQIRMAWKRLAAKLHPDRNAAPGATAQLAEVNTAYEVLSDADRRRRYDETGETRQDDTRARIVGLLMKAASAALDQWKPNQPGMARTLLGQVRVVMDAQRAQLVENLSQLDDMTRHLEKVRGKVRGTGETNLFHQLIDEKLEGLARNRDQVRQMISHMTAASGLLSGYSEDDWGERMAVLSRPGVAYTQTFRFP